MVDESLNVGSGTGELDISYDVPSDGGVDKFPKFVKFHDDSFGFVSHQADFVRTEEFSRQKAVNIYLEIVGQRNQFVESLKKLQKDFDANFIEKDVELEKFLLMADMAAKYKKFLGLRDNLDSVKDSLVNLNKQIIDMENVVPELRRLGKN